MNRFASLSSRLVLTTVLLVAVTSLILGSATILAFRASLTSQLDADVLASLGRGEPRSGDGFGGADDGGRDGGRDEGRHDFDDPMPGVVLGSMDGNFAPGTLLVVLGETPSGAIVGSRYGEGIGLSAQALEQLDAVPLDGEVHSVRLPGSGRYRVSGATAGDGTVVLVGLPTRGLDETIGELVAWELALVALGVAAAAGVGLIVVRRQMRPLREVAATAHEVAELPLSQGEIDLTARVPAYLTDERTEVGQVGAALNRLLEHVESSLAARHRSEQQVRQFVADASHELRTPLATIAGYTELARRRPEDVPAVQAALAKVESESDRMTALVEDLLLLARLDAGRPLAREQVDLTRLVLEAVADAQVLAPAHQWRLELPKEIIEVDGDEARLHQVVTNLLTNARKYTPEGSTITVGARQDEGRSVLTIHDNGPGFPDGLAENAFERFVRGDAARTRAGSGAGLGLALVKAIVDEHGGTVALSSAAGDTTVTITLPRLGPGHR
jgi:two-component system OmpR family sensor kinase